MRCIVIFLCNKNIISYKIIDTKFVSFEKMTFEFEKHLSCIFYCILKFLKKLRLSSTLRRSCMQTKLLFIKFTTKLLIRKLASCII